MSGDFDPRVLWTRREAALALAGGAAAGAAGPALASDAEWAGRGGPRTMLVTDAALTGAPARRIAHLLEAGLAVMPRRTDPLRFWQAQVAPALRPGAPVAGLTSWADYLVLRGAAAEARYRVRFDTASGLTPEDARLAALAARLRQAMAGAPDADSAGRIGWILA